MQRIKKWIIGILACGSLLTATTVYADDKLSNGSKEELTATIVSEEMERDSLENINEQNDNEIVLDSSGNNQTDNSVVQNDVYTSTTASETDKDLENYLQRTDDLFPLQESRSDLNGSAGKRNLRSLGRSSFSIPIINAGEAGRPRFDFIDVSSWNNNLKVSDYVKIKNYGIKSVIVKLTEATSYQNPYAADQIKNAHAAGLKVHVYHYSWFTSVAAARREAEYFAALAKKLQLSSSTIMVNDIEEPKIINSGDHTTNS